jgi:hypothetical protein
MSAQAKKYVDDSISNLINGAPATLDTLKELATAIGNNPHLASDVLTSLYSLNNLIHLDISSNSTILNTNSILTVGQYNSGNGVANQFFSADANNFSVFNNFVVNNISGVQTTSSLYNRSSIDTMLKNFPYQKFFFMNNINGTYMKLCSFALPNQGSNVKFTITYSAAYPDFKQGDILTIHFFNSDGINLTNGFNGGAVGYSMGPLSVSSDSLSSNRGKPIIFKQIFTNTFELWFWDYSVKSQCVLEISGIGDFNDIQYDGVSTNNNIIGNIITPQIYTFWNSDNLPYDKINGNLFGYYSKDFIDAHFYQKTDLDLKFVNYYTQSDMMTLLNTYQPISGMSNYFSKTQIINN